MEVEGNASGPDEAGEVRKQLSFSGSESGPGVGQGQTGSEPGPTGPAVKLTAAPVRGRRFGTESGVGHDPEYQVGPGVEPAEPAHGSWTGPVHGPANRPPPAHLAPELDWAGPGRAGPAESVWVTGGNMGQKSHVSSKV